MSLHRPDGWAGQKYVPTAGTSLHAAVMGRAEPPDVVCVHGVGASHRYFLPLARQLADDARVTAVDLPGFGRTPGPRRALDIRGLADALGDWLAASGRMRPVMVANSLGAQVVVDLAARRPALQGPLVLVGPTMDALARSLPRQALRLAADVPAEKLSLAWLLSTDYARCGPRRYLATVRHGLRDRIEENARQVTGPVTVLRGALDPVCPREWAQHLAAALPDGNAEEVPGAGHAVHHSHPAAVAAVVRSLLHGHAQ